MLWLLGSSYCSDMAKTKKSLTPRRKKAWRGAGSRLCGHILVSIVAYNGTPPSNSLIILLRFTFRSFLFSVSSSSLDDPVYFGTLSQFAIQSRTSYRTAPSPFPDPEPKFRATGNTATFRVPCDCEQGNGAARWSVFNLRGGGDGRSEGQGSLPDWNRVRRAQRAHLSIIDEGSKLNLPKKQCAL